MLYHISKYKILMPMIPRIPKSKFEDQTTPRICFSTSIQGCLIGVNENKDISGEIYHVYGLETSDYITPTKEQVKDVDITGEVWVTEKCSPKHLYDIKVIGKKSEKTEKINGKMFKVPVWDYEKIENMQESEVQDGDEKLLESIQKYDPPYNAKQIKDNYGDETYSRLVKDPAHKWRMDTGIELIHKEPSKEELERIWKNWNLMSDTDKRKSDDESILLFGMNNREHYNKLIKESSEIKSYNIYITGLPGSGKTTKAKQLAKETGFEVWHLDEFEPLHKPKSDKVRKWYIRHIHHSYVKMFENNEEMSDNQISYVFERFLEWSNKQSGLIVEGVQILGCEDMIDSNRHKLILLDVDKKTCKNRVLSRGGEKIPEYNEYDNKISDFKKYPNVDVLKEFHLDTILTKPFSLNKDIIVYHYSDKKVDILEPKGLNIGNKLSPKKVKSVWFTEDETNWVFPLQCYLKYNFKDEWHKNFTWYFDSNKRDKRTNTIFHGLIMTEDFYKRKKHIIDNYKLYRYEKTFKIKELGRGTEPTVPEWTYDEPVKPDNVKIRTGKDLFSDGNIKIGTKEEVLAAAEYFKDCLSKGQHISDMIDYKVEWWKYNFDKYHEIRKKTEEKRNMPGFKELHIKESEILDESVNKNKILDILNKKLDFINTETEYGNTNKNNAKLLRTISTAAPEGSTIKSPKTFEKIKIGACIERAMFFNDKLNYDSYYLSFRCKEKNFGHTILVIKTDDFLVVPDYFGIKKYNNCSDIIKFYSTKYCDGLKFDFISKNKDISFLIGTETKKIWDNLENNFLDLKESEILDEQINSETILDKAREIMEKMNDIEYGSVYADGRKSKRDRDDWYDDSNKFCPQPVLSVLKHKMGHCIDQSELERYYFKKANIKHKVFSMFPERGSNMYHNHTFLLFFDENDTPYWFDHAWYSERGIHKGESLNELFKKICDKKRKADPQNDPENAEKFKYIKYEIFEVPAKSCLCWDDYVDWVWKQKLVYKG